MPLDIAQIRDLRPQNEIQYFASCGSTMTEAAKLLSAGAPHGTVVLSDEQTAGIGRLGRTWVSRPDLGVYCSIVLRLPLPPSGAPIASLLVGLATSNAIEQLTYLRSDLRWPNDVLLNERKVAGILTQLVDKSIIAGIGINVNNLSFDPGLRTPATSLRLESNGRLQSREQLIAHLLESLDAQCSTLATEGVESILRAFTLISSYARGRRVIVEESGKRGVTSGLDQNGFLMVRYEDGRLAHVVAGGVRPDA